MPTAKQITQTIELLKREKDLQWLFEQLPDWKVFQLVSLVVSHYERVAAHEKRDENG